MKMFVSAVGAAFALGACAPQQAATGADAASVEAGRHLVLVGACNDCHTPGYAEANGAVPEAQWLTGTPVGFRGPWGVSYPANLRNVVAAMSEDEWAQSLKARTGLPPMPWGALNAMDETELRSLYRFIKSLGPGGEDMPTALPPGEPVRTPTFWFVPLAPGERSPP
ncbi:MAG: cytochrome C [Hyphomonadaceae bacterium]